MSADAQDDFSSSSLAKKSSIYHAAVNPAGRPGDPGKMTHGLMPLLRLRFAPSSLPDTISPNSTHKEREVMKLTFILSLILINFSSKCASADGPLPSSTSTLPFAPLHADTLMIPTAPIASSRSASCTA